MITLDTTDETELRKKIDESIGYTKYLMSEVCDEAGKALHYQLHSSNAASYETPQEFQNLREVAIYLTAVNRHSTF